MLVVVNDGDAMRCRIEALARGRGAKKEAAGRRQSKEVDLLKQEEEQQQAALTLQRLSCVRAAKLEADERRQRKEAAVRVGGPIFFTKWSGNLLCLQR